MGKKHLHILSFVLAFAVTLSCFTPAQYATAKNKIESFTPLSDSEQSDGSIAPVKTTSDAITLPDADDTSTSGATVTQQGVMMDSGTPTVLYETTFDELPAELTGSSGWSIVTLKDGYALKGISGVTKALLTALPSASQDLPSAYTVVIDMALSENLSSTGYSAGLVFLHTDSENFYHHRLDIGVSQNAQLYQWSGGSATKHIDFPLSIEKLHAYRLRVTVDDAAINCYVDGIKTAAHTASSTEGDIGLRVYNAEALFDNLTIYAGVVAPPAEGENATQFEFPQEQPTILNNETPDCYAEPEGEWDDAPDIGQDDSSARVAGEGGKASFSIYPPKTGNFTVEWYVPEADNAESEFTVQTLNGIWKYEFPANTGTGWCKLGTVTATIGTAFTITVSSGGKIYADAVRLMSTQEKADEPYNPVGGGSNEIAVLVNQIGYDNGKPKRATVPNADDGTEFKVINSATEQTAFTGEIKDNIADFSGLETDEDTDFYIICANARSYDFTIGSDLIQRRSVKNALDFMNQVRSDTFEWGRSGIGWRDSHQFSFELNSLVLQYMANPSLYENLPYSIVHTDTCEYQELRTQDEPDLIWLIQFAALRYYDWGHNEGKKLHMLTKEQLAYFLYLYPEISRYVPRETYEAIKDYTIEVWGENACDVQWYGIPNTNHDLYSIQKIFGGLKGSQPPGHSIVPNLLMHEVAKRDGLGDDVAQKFFDAAYANCEYTINDIDITDPYYCKGQRMSEYITVPALAYFLEMYPDTAPSGLEAALEGWAEKTIARSDNLWNIRMAASMKAGDGVYTFHNKEGNIDKDYWTGAAYAIADGQSNAPKNEPGNQAGLQAVTYAATRILDDPDTKQRLVELGVAAIDDLFGRNPSGRASFYHFVRDFEGADLGWYVQFRGGNGVLGGCTAVIDANAPELCYPYAPQNYNTGYTEGWVAYNTAWNTSLAYSAAEAVALEATESGLVGQEVTIRLKAPLNLDTKKVETGDVTVATSTGEKTIVPVTETDADSVCLEGSYVLPNVPYVTVSYGSGIFRQSAEVKVTDATTTAVTGITLDKSSLSLSVGENARLIASIQPDDASDKRVIFTSSDSKMAIVTDDGVVKAVAVGTANIIAASVSDPEVSAVCTITVTAAKPQSLRMSVPSTLSVFDTDKTAKITGVVYADGSVVTDNLPQATFSTEQTGIIQVGAVDGKLTGLRAGIATITASAIVDGMTVTGSAKLTVTAVKDYDLLTLYKEGMTSASAGAKAEEITDNGIGKQRLKLTGDTEVGGTVDFQLGGLRVGSYQVILNSKYYSSYGIWKFQLDGEMIGSEVDFNQTDKNGFYHDLALGTINVSDDASHTFIFISCSTGAKPVVPVKLSFVMVDPKADLEALAEEASTYQESDYTLESWNTFADALAEAKRILNDPNADQSAITEAFNVLRTSIDTLESQYNITVDERIVNGTVTADTASVAEGDEVTLTITPADHYWLAENSLKVYKTGDLGTTVPVTGNKFTMPAYDVTITAQFEKIPNEPVPVTGVTLDRESITLNSNSGSNTVQLIAAVTPENATNKKVTWTSSNTNVVTVDAIGVGIAEVTAISVGTAAITVATEDGGFTDTCEVTVTTEAPIQYDMTVDNGIANGAVTADKAATAPGDEVTLTVAPDNNYRLAEDSLKVYKTGDPDTTIPVTGNKFTMPGYDVTVTARFEKIPGQGTYTLTIRAGIGGSIRRGESGDYAAGTVISIAAAAKRGYRFRGWTTNAGGTFGNPNSASTTFVMPENNVVVTAVFTRIKDDDDNKPEPKIDVIREDTTQIVSAEIRPVNNAAIGISYARINSRTIAALVDKADKLQRPDERSIIEVKVELQESAKKVEADFPRAAFRKLAEDTEADLRVSTGVGNITFDRRALVAINDAAPSGDVRITIEKVEKSSLPSDIRSIAGDRPVYHLAVEAGDSSVTSFGGGNAFVSLPYTPGTGEDEDCIVVYYLDDAGELNPARGRYDRQTGMVSFTTRHFSNFMIGYNKVTFHDVDKNEWYRRAVGFTAARGVIEGRGDGSFAPTENVTRADFLIMLMNAYGIEPDKAITDNFIDAGNKYYTGYLGAAKRMGIAAGVGGNKYLPESTISRQDMFVLLYRALEVLGELPEDSYGRKLESFDDMKDIASYAKDVMRFFAEAGIVNGNGTSLAPEDTSTRAQAAQTLYNLLSK